MNKEPIQIFDIIKAVREAKIFRHVPNQKGNVFKIVVLPMMKSINGK
jgi:hypothetical protein